MILCRLGPNHRNPHVVFLLIPTFARRCTYDFLEISESDQTQMDIQKLSLGQLSSSTQQTGTGSASAATASSQWSSPSTSSSWYNKVVYKVFNRNSSSTTAFNPSLITADLLNSDAMVTQNGASGGGAATHGNDRAWEYFSRIAAAVPRRMCGDWSPKLKLLRYVTKKPALLFHFASDYSHQSGGYKAKVFIENGESKSVAELQSLVSQRKVNKEGLRRVRKAKKGREEIIK